MSDELTDRNNKNEEELSGMNEQSEKEEKTTEPTMNSGEAVAEPGQEAGRIESDIQKLQSQLEDSTSQMNAYKDQLLRLAAEFENFRKRTEAERAEFVKYSHEKIIKDLLPILDDFERAMTNGKKNTDFDSFYKGVEMIYQKLQKVFEEKGVKPIDSLGKEFDVMYHDVLMQMQKPGAPPHTIIEEVERGYTLHGKVIKHAKVIVAADQPAESPADEDSGSESKN